jgi:hypothetical protein
VDGAAPGGDRGGGTARRRQSPLRLTRYEAAGPSISRLPEDPDPADPAVCGLPGPEPPRRDGPRSTISASLRSGHVRIVPRAAEAAMRLNGREA